MENDSKIIPTKSGNKIIETYAGDMAKVLENDKEGLVRKIIHGEEEHEAQKRNLSPESRKNKIFMLISILLLFFSLIALSFFVFMKDDNTVEVAEQFTPLIFNDKSDFIEVAGLNKDKIAQTVFNTISSAKIKSGGVEGIYLSYNKKVIGFRRFIELINGSLILNDSNNLVSDNFLMGVVNDQVDPTSLVGRDFFILIKMRSIPDIFDSLQSWENKMFLDLHGFFGVNIREETAYLLTSNFKDNVVENKNARILYDKNNKIVMMYVFADDNSALITNSEKATHEIILRLSSSQVKQ